MSLFGFFFNTFVANGKCWVSVHDRWIYACTAYGKQPNFLSKKIWIWMEFISHCRPNYSVPYFRFFIRTHAHAHTLKIETRRKIVNIIIISGTWEPHAALCRVIADDHATADHLFLATRLISTEATLFELHIHMIYTQQHTESTEQFIFIFQSECYFILTGVRTISWND